MMRDPTPALRAYHGRQDLTAVGEETALTLRQERDALAAMAWQPIETAPKDRDIIVLTDSIVGLEPIVSKCRWHPDAGFCVDELREPRWWMELPPPPTGETERAR